MSGLRWAIVLAGGGGTRLWPASTPERPKQVAPILPGGRTLIGEALDRLSPLVPPERTFVVTAPLPAAALEALVRGRATLVIEPEPRNTGPAVALGLATVLAAGASADDVLIVVPADTWVEDGAAWTRNLDRAVDAAREGALCLLCAPSTYAATAFGWIVGTSRDDGVVDVHRFEEKPLSARAAELWAQGAWWNAGVFVAPVAWLTAEWARIDAVAARGIEGVAAYLRPGAGPDAPSFVARALAAVPTGPFDRLVVEQASRVRAVPLDGAWADLGTWDAVAAQLGAVAGGRGVAAQVVASQSEGNLVFAPGLDVVLLGVEDLVVACTNGGLLIARRSALDGLRDAVGQIEPSPSAGRPQ